MRSSRPSPRLTEHSDADRVRAPSPSPAEVQAARLPARLTQSAAAAVVYANLRSWQKWEAGERVMHPAFMELFRLKTAQGTLSYP